MPGPPGGGRGARPASGAAGPSSEGRAGLCPGHRQHPRPPAQPRPCRVPLPPQGAARPPRHHVRPARARSHSPSSSRPPWCCLSGGLAVPGTHGDGGERSEPGSSARSGPRAPGPAPLTADAPPRWPGRQKGRSSQQAPHEARGNSRESRPRHAPPRPAAANAPERGGGPGRGGASFGVGVATVSGGGSLVNA